MLTREHVPPKSVGGKRIVLTCAACNHSGGHGPDSHMRRETDVYDFAAGNLRQIKADLSTDAGRLPIRLLVRDNTIRMAAVEKAVRPEVHHDVMDDFGNRLDNPDKADSVAFSVEFEAFSRKQAATSWLRSAYLAFFAALGYRFIVRPELDLIRQKIENPEQDEPSTFRIIRSESSRPMLLRVESPEVFRSYVMLHGRNAIFLPRYKDRTLYERLGEHPDTEVRFTAKAYRWPSNGPTFFHDQAQLAAQGDY